MAIVALIVMWACFRKWVLHRLLRNDFTEFTCNLVEVGNSFTVNLVNISPWILVLSLTNRQIWLIWQVLGLCSDAHAHMHVHKYAQTQQPGRAPKRPDLAVHRGAWLIGLPPLQAKVTKKLEQEKEKSEKALNRSRPLGRTSAGLTSTKGTRRLSFHSMLFIFSFLLK